MSVASIECTTSGSLTLKKHSPVSIMEDSARHLVCTLIGDSRPGSRFYHENSVYNQVAELVNDHRDEVLDPSPQINSALSQLVSILQGNVPGKNTSSNTFKFVAVAQLACDIIDKDHILSQRANDIISISTRAEFRLELHYVKKILTEPQERLNDIAKLPYPQRVAYASRTFPYVSNYTTIVAEEVKVLNQFGTFSHIVFCGSGPLPLTGLLLSTHVSAKLTFVDIDADAVKLSRELIQCWEEKDIIPAGRIQVIHENIANIANETLSSCDALFIAALIPNQVIQTLFKCAAKLQSKSPLLILRSAHGLTARFAYHPSSRRMLGKYLSLVGTAVPETHASSKSPNHPPAIDGDDQVPMSWFPHEILNSLELYSYSDRGVVCTE